MKSPMRAGSTSVAGLSWGSGGTSCALWPRLELIGEVGTASPGRYSNTGHRAKAGGDGAVCARAQDPGADCVFELEVVERIQEQCTVEFSRVVHVPVLMQLQFQQSLSFVTAKVPQIQFIVRLREVPVVRQKWVLAVQKVEIPEVQVLLVVDVAVIMQRQSAVPQTISSTGLYDVFAAGLIVSLQCFHFFSDSVFFDVEQKQQQQPPPLSLTPIPSSPHPSYCDDEPLFGGPCEAKVTVSMNLTLDPVPLASSRVGEFFSF